MNHLQHIWFQVHVLDKYMTLSENLPAPVFMNSKNCVLVYILLIYALNLPLVVKR